MFGFPTQFKYIVAPLLLVLTSVVLQLTESISFDHLGFLPQQIQAGEYWRVITGLLYHTNYNHLAMNIGGLLLVWALHGEYYSAKHYALIVFINLLFIGTALAVLYPNIIYSGLSGVIHGLLIYGAVIDISKHKPSGWLIIIGVWGKVYYELNYGAQASTAELIDANVAVEAHLLGALLGSLLGATYLVINRRRITCQ